MERNEIERGANGSKRELSTSELVSRAIDRTQALLREEMALARAETKEQLAATIKTGVGLGVAAVSGLLGAMLLLTAAVAALSLALQVWAAALIVAGAVFLVGIVAGAAGWAKRVRAPLARTVRTTKEDISWAKDRIS